MSVNSSAYAMPPSALGAWVGMAQSTRVGLTSGPPPTDTAMSSLLTYFQPLLVYVIFMILFTVITAVGGIGQCCCLLCCKRRVMRKQARRGPPTQTRKYTIFGLLGTLFFAWFIGATIVFSSSPYMTTSLANMQTSLVASITDVQIIFNGISPAFILAVSKLQKQLPEEIKLFNAAIDQNGINATIRDPLLSIANDLDSTQTNVVTMNSTANTIFSSRQTLIADQTTLGTMQGSITGQISALSSTTKPLTSNSGVNWKLTNPLVTPATLGSNLNSVRNVQSPDGQSAVASVRDLDLSTYALDLRIKGNNATTNVDATISKESSKVTVDVDKSFAKVNSSVTDSLGPITNDFNKAATEFIKSVNDVFDTQVKQFDGIRNGIMIAIAVFFYFIIAVIGFGTYRKSPKLMKGCNLSSTIFYVLFFILGILILILATVIGLSCQVIFANRTQGPLGSLGVQGSVNQAFDFKAECYANKSLLQAASNLGLVNSTSSNLTAQTENKLNEQDFSALTTWSSSDTVTLNESPADKTSGIRNMDLSSLATGMTDITNAIVNTIPALMTDLNALQTQINTANTAASIPDLTISPNTATNAEKDEALADYKTELTAISAAIQAEKDLLLAINNTCTTLLTNIVSLNDTAVRTNVTALTFQPKYEQLLTNFTVLETQMKQALNNTLPAFKSSVLKFVAGLEGDINVALNCRIIAVDLDAIENAVCGDTLSALDAVWLAMIYLGMLSMLSMPIVIWSANVLYPLDRNQIHDAELIPSDEDQAEYPTKDLASAPPMEDRILRTGVADE